MTKENKVKSNINTTKKIRPHFAQNIRTVLFYDAICGRTFAPVSSEADNRIYIINAKIACFFPSPGTSHIRTPEFNTQLQLAAYANHGNQQ